VAWRQNADHKYTGDIWMAFVTVEAHGPRWWGAGDGRSQSKKKLLLMRRQMGSIEIFMRGALQTRQ